MHFLKVISTQDKKNYRSIIGLKQSNSALFHLVVKSDQSIDVNEKPALEKMFYIERDLGIEIKHWCTAASTRMSILGICYCTCATNEGGDRPTASC